MKEVERKESGRSYCISLSDGSLGHALRQIRRSLDRSHGGGRNY